MKLLFIFSIIFLFSCSKQAEQPNNNCKTCTENVHYNISGQPSTDYIASQTTYCDGQWISYDGKTWTKSGTTAGNHWSQVHKITCK